MSEPLWTPAEEQLAAAQLTRFTEFLRDLYGDAAGDDGAAEGDDQRQRVAAAVAEVGSYESLYRFSLAHPDCFWEALASFCRVEMHGSWSPVVTGIDKMAPPDPDPGRGPWWFGGAKLNFARNLMWHVLDRDAEHVAPSDPAIIAWNENGRHSWLTWGELRHRVRCIRAALQGWGVQPGDRVSAVLPNIPDAVAAMLAAASLGAVWSSCSPDFGAAGILDRFGQIEPKVLLCAESYQYNGKVIELLPRMRELAAQLPTVERVIVCEYLSEADDLSGLPAAVRLRELLAADPTEVVADWADFPFNHPLYILYSSGTTGLPKCMVHGAGGTLLQHLKELALHSDIRPGQRLFYFTTCGWMMWNWQVSALACGATLVLYDGSPFAPRPEILWDMAAEEGVTHFGTSAKYLALLEKQGVRPAETHDLSELQAVLSTGSPLAPASFDYVYAHVKADVQLASISGGTDIVSCFALGCPTEPVHRGELQCRGLGMAVDVYDAEGHPTDGPGELVCTMPFPSMPVRFWNDPDGSKYRSAYFDHFPGVWRHGDWCELADHGADRPAGLIMHGRSDATLNPGGVRIGTAEIYRAVEALDEVVESLVIGQEWDGDTRIVLFVRLREGLGLDEPLRERICAAIRGGCSPHHVPKRVVQVGDIPRTRSGKLVELAVREAVHGRPVLNTEALANPEALDQFRERAELQS